ncbi:MAG: hypothetical protein FWD13_07485 [Treponema sp.]|nr:hypothetical protein [Treponema sp.]
MNRLVFLPVPKSFREQFNKTNAAFSIDPNIPIPVEIPNEGNETGLSNLSMDMIILGMLRAIEEKQVKQEWLDYYSAFILYLRPDILEICQNHEEKKCLTTE